MIIINQNYGQLGNRLFLYAHLLVYGLEHKRTVFYPGFFDRVDTFPNIRKLSVKNKWLGNSLEEWFDRWVYAFLHRFFYHGSKPLRFLEQVSGRAFHIHMDQFQDRFYPEFEADRRLPGGLCLFQGWAFRMHEAFRKHSPFIRSMFEFDEGTRRAAQEFLQKFRGEWTVGIHVRRGDYATAAPQWVYPDQYWIDSINSIKSASDGRGQFIVVSDDPAFKIEVDRVHRFIGSDVLDMAVLSCCDFIMGPPSTYNRWAAFAGNKRHYCVWSSADNPTLESFQPFKMASSQEVVLSPSEMEAVRWFGIA